MRQFTIAYNPEQISTRPYGVCYIYAVVQSIPPLEKNM